MEKVFIRWTDDISVKVVAMDDQHKKLFDIINRLYAAFTENKHKEIVKNILNELVNYTKTHFADEEKQLMMYEYPYIEEQIKQHAEFVGELNKFIAEYEVNPDTLTFKLMTFIQKWITDHIKQTDKKYSSFLESKGLK